MPESPPIRCPRCGKTVPTGDSGRPAAFPFCCERCRLLDLGCWLDGSYAIAGKQAGMDGDPEA